MSSSNADTAGPIPAGATVVADPDHVSTAVDDEVVVLHLPTGTYHGLNGVGAHLWGRLAEPRRVADLVASVADAYDVDPVECEPDVRAFVADLAALELVTVADADADADGADDERRP